MTSAKLLWIFRMSAARIGREGGISICLFGACMLGYIAFLAPLRTQLDRAEAEFIVASHRSAPTATRFVAREALDHFYAGLPSVDDQFLLMARLHKAAASNGLILERGDYKFAEEGGVPLVRYEIELPVKGDYAQIRRFVFAAMQDLPTLALKSISFGRQKSDEAQLNANVVLVLYLGKVRT